MDAMNEFWRIFGWFSLVWFASAGTMVILMQFLLPRAWKEIRAHPPTGPAWAHTLWYRRNHVYGAMMAISLALGTLAALLYMLGLL